MKMDNKKAFSDDQIQEMINNQLIKLERAQKSFNKTTKHLTETLDACDNLLKKIESRNFPNE